MKVPLVFALFLASPWVLYQVWAFISPGLYQKEKRLALPFVLSTAGLFILGGCFAYFVAFRFGLAFLLSIGLTNGVTPLVTITHYFDLFVNVMLGVALVFELPVAIFFLTLLHLASPRFLLRAFALRDSRDRHCGGDHYAYAGFLQPDAVRGAHVPAVFRGRIRELPAGDEARRQEVPVDQGAVDHTAGRPAARRSH